ncbi:MAG: DMT family transporter, partial [Anaerolineae bacterium]
MPKNSTTPYAMNSEVKQPDSSKNPYASQGESRVLHQHSKIKFGEQSKPLRKVLQWQADALLLAVALIWGSTFVLVKQTVLNFPVYTFLALRFALAATMLFLLFGRRLRALHPRMLGAGIAIGLFLFGGYAFQTIGLQYTSASKAGFITGLSVVIVPCLSALLLKRMPARQAWLGVILATAGLALLTLEHDLVPSRGDLIVLGCAFCFALHITAVSLFAPQTDALALTLVQITTVAVLSGLAMLVTANWKWPIPNEVLYAAMFTGVLATALAFAIQ